MLKKILKEVLNLREAKEIKKNDFMCFYIDEIKDLDNITDVHDLGEKKNVEVYLITDKNYDPDDPKGTWYKINTEDLIKYMAKTIDKFKDGDYLDFMGSYGVGDVIVGFLCSKYEVKHYKDWNEFVRTVSGDYKKNTM